MTSTGFACTTSKDVYHHKMVTTISPKILRDCIYLNNLESHIFPMRGYVQWPITHCFHDIFETWHVVKHTKNCHYCCDKMERFRFQLQPNYNPSCQNSITLDLFHLFTSCNFHMFLLFIPSFASVDPYYISCIPFTENGKIFQVKMGSSIQHVFHYWCIKMRHTATS